MSLVYLADAAIAGSKRNGVYIGGKKDAKSSEKLQRWGISHILNVTPTKDVAVKAGVPNYFESSNKKLKYLRIPVYDVATSVNELEAQSDQIVDFISNGLYHGSVLVHCNHGVSRSTTCVLLYLMRKIGMTLDDAIASIRRRRPEAEPIPAFWEFLQRQEEFLKQDEKSQLSINNKRKSETTTNKDKNNNDDSPNPKRQKTVETNAAKKKAPIGPQIMPTVSNKKKVIGPQMQPPPPKKGD